MAEHDRHGLRAYTRTITALTERVETLHSRLVAGEQIGTDLIQADLDLIGRVAKWAAREVERDEAALRTDITIEQFLGGDL